jgi:uncharacterized GH25 family protein
MLRLLLLAAFVFACSIASAHDTWVQTNSNLVRTGDAVFIDLMLGNHGNEHRDFKLASKVDRAVAKLTIISPTGRSYDVADRLVDLGYAPKEGFYAAKFAGAEEGLYTIAHASDRVVNHGQPVRSLKSAKTFFVASPSLDKPNPHNPGFDKPLGHPLELVPIVSPVLPMGPGQAIRVQALLKGQPLAGARVSFIPRGELLSEGFDERYERTTDSAGRASFEPTSGNYYLAVVHHVASDEKGADYVETHYSATMTVLVPEVCACCGE